MSRKSLAAILLLALLLVGCDSTPSKLPDETNNPAASNQAYGSGLPVAESTIPAEDYTPEPYPTPNEQQLNPTSTPGLVPLNPPTTTVLSTASIKDIIGRPLVWAVEADTNLTLWLGSFRESPQPAVSNARAIVRWNEPLKIKSIKVSPNQEQLAVLVEEPTAVSALEREDSDHVANNPRWLWHINLNDNTTTLLPSTTDAGAYNSFYADDTNYIVGWLDDTKLLLQRGSSLGTVNADGANYSKFVLQPSWDVLEADLSADRSKILSFNLGDPAKDGLWTYNPDGSNQKRVGDVKPVHTSQWSPDGNYVSFFVNSDNFTTHQLWTLKTSSPYSQKQVSSIGKWDVVSSWSSDSSHLAFLRADSTGELRDYQQPASYDTNIFIHNISAGTTKLTSFSGVRSSSLTWTDSGNYLLAASTASSDANSAQSNIVAVSTTTGAVTTLVASNGDALVQPTLIRSLD